MSTAVPRECLGGWTELLGPVTPVERHGGDGMGFAATVDWLDATVVERPSHRVDRLILRPDRGDAVNGLIAIPSGETKGIVVALHQTTEPVTVGVDEPFGLGGTPDLNYGEGLAAMGFLVVGVNYPGFGDYACRPYELGYRSVTAKGLWNHQELLRLTAERFGTMPTAAVGHSLGGTNALLLGAWSPGVDVTVVSGAFTTFSSFAERHGGNLSRWSRPEKYMPAIRTRFGDDPGRVPCDFDDLVRCVHPRPLFASITRGDEIFPIDGARDLVRIGQELYGARSDAFRCVESEGLHSFPKEARRAAYSFVEERMTRIDPGQGLPRGR